jgi:hypothetical protein
MPLPRVVRTVAWVGLALAGACTEVDGGAVEVSWVFRTDRGDRRDCGQIDVGQVELRWGSASADRVAFPCRDERGVTGFDLPVGPRSLYLRPICADGSPAADGSYRAPAPIVRTITDGDVITLDTQLIEVRVTGCGEATPCICR